MDEGPEQGDLAARLPRDVLADVLHRVAAQQRWLAVSRCVCKAWRAVIDDERLLCTELPFSGLFLSFTWLPLPEFFSRSRSASPGQPPVTGKLDFLPSEVDVRSVGYFGEDSDFRIQGHCNGLLLLERHVVNPATRCWYALPFGPSSHVGGVVLNTFDHDYHLAFDPTVSSHYQVFQIPYLCECDPLEEASEWPPSPYALHVFSSRTGCWEERSFVRQGDAHGTVSEMCESLGGESRLRSVCWRGSLYVHCQTDFVVRISLSEDRYSVIKPPMGVGYNPYLGLSEKGVYFASFVSNHVRVCMLDESSDRPEWILKHDYDLKPIVAFDSQVTHGSWVLEDINYDFFHSHLSQFKKEATTLQDTFEWDSDNDDFHDNKDIVEACHHHCFDIEILGFHPYKEIMFLSRSVSYKSDATAFAYHLNSFKVERLGSIYPTGYEYFDIGLPNDERNIESFPYTPCCWTREIEKRQSN